jgi:DNA polymerase-3 subunit beta
METTITPPSITTSTPTLIDQSALKAALDKAAKFVARKSSLPVLSTVLLNAWPGYLEITATNLEIALRVRLRTQGHGEFTAAVPFKALQEALGRISGAISLTLEEQRTSHETGPDTIERTLILDKTGGQVKIKHCLDAEEYPSFRFAAEGEPLHLFTLGSDVFAREIKRVARYAASEEARPVFCGVLFEIERNGTGNVRFVTADSYRLGWSEVTVSDVLNIPEWVFWSEEPTTDLLPPASGLETLVSILPKQSSELCFARIAQGGQLAVTWTGEKEAGNPEYLFLTRLIDGKFPPYRRILDQTAPTHTVVVESENLLAALEAFGREIFRNSTNMVEVSLETTRLKLDVTSEEADQTEYVPLEGAQEPGEEMTIKLNAEYMKDACRAFTGRMVLRLWSPQKPVEFRTLHADENSHVCVLMPFHTIR